MPRPTSPFRVNDFLGLSDQAGPEVHPDGATVLQNLYPDRGGLVRRGGTSPLAEANLTPAQDLDGLIWARLADTEVLLSAHGGAVYDWLSGVPPFLLANSTAKLTSASPASFAWVANAVYAGDGLKQNVRVTAARVDQAMTSVPLTGVTLADGGAGTLPAGTYQYRVTFLSADGFDSEPSAAASVTIGANRRVTVSNIPLAPAGEDASGRRIYRTGAGTTTFHRLTTISDNTTTTYTDNTADVASNPALVTGNTRFPPCALLIEHHHRLIGADCRTADGNRRTVYISNFGAPYYAPLSPDLEEPSQGTQIELSGRVAGIVTGLASHGDKVWVFTATNLYVLGGEQPLDFSLLPFAEVGCAAHRTLVSLRDALYWLAPDGVYRAAEGQGIERISDPVQGWVDGLTATDFARACAFAWQQRVYVVTPSSCRWFDTRYGRWGENTTWAFRIGAVGGLSAGARPRLFGAKSGAGRAWELEVGTDDNGTAIPSVWESADLDFGLPGREKRLHYLGCLWKLGSGTATLTLTKGTGLAIETLTKDVSEALVAGGTVARLFQRVTEQARDEWFRVRVSHPGSALPYRILAADGQWTEAT